MPWTQGKIGARGEDSTGKTVNIRAGDCTAASYGGQSKKGPLYLKRGETKDGTAKRKLFLGSAVGPGNLGLTKEGEGNRLIRCY